VSHAKMAEPINNLITSGFVDGVMFWYYEAMQ